MTRHSNSSNTAILPIVGGGILTLLWGAYTILIVAEVAMMGPL